MGISVVLLCAAVTIAATWLWWRGRRARILLQGLPTFSQIPLLGCIHKVYGGGEALFRALDEMAQKSEETNLPFTFWVGTCPIILFIDPEDVKVVSNTYTDKPYFYEFTKPWLGNGLITAPGYIWKRSIKRLGGSFTSTIVEGFQGVFDAQAQKLVALLRGRVGDPPFDVIHDLTAVTLEAICQTALGAPGMSESIATDEYCEAFEQTLRLVIERGTNIFLHPNPIYRLTPAYRKFIKSNTVLHNVSKSIITRRKAEWNEKLKQDNGESIQSATPKFKSYLDIILEMGSSDPIFTAEQIQAEVDTIIFAGQETTATSLYFTLLMLGYHEKVQEKLYAEIQAIFGDSDRPVEKEDLYRMEYCEAVILETMRMYPPVAGVLRYADKDLQLKSCLVPKGAICAINILGACHSRRAWGPDALQFRPERWLDPALDATSFYVFSYGRRACNGRKYAVALVKTMLANLLREFRFTSEAAELKLKMDVILRPVTPLKIQVHSRKTTHQRKNTNFLESIENFKERSL